MKKKEKETNEKWKKRGENERKKNHPEETKKDWIKTNEKEKTKKKSVIKQKMWRNYIKRRITHVLDV